MRRKQVVLLVLCLLPFSESFQLLFSSSTSGQVAGKSPSRASWIDRVNELVEYKQQYGNTLVPKRYVDNPALGNWVNKQRQLYRKYCANETTSCSLTAEKVKILESLGFCWDASSQESKASEADNELWWYRFENLKLSYGSLEDKLPPSALLFLREQRREFLKYQNGQSSALDPAKISALKGLDPGWSKTSHQRQWDKRVEELKEYRAEHGDCCVPIGYENPKLAHWVSNVRKKYNLRVSGQHSTLTKEQINQLNSIGFVWDYWDYEYGTRLGRQGSI